MKHNSPALLSRSPIRRCRTGMIRTIVLDDWWRYRKLRSESGSLLWTNTRCGEIPKIGRAGCWHDEGGIKTGTVNLRAWDRTIGYTNRLLNDCRGIKTGTVNLRAWDRTVGLTKRLLNGWSHRSSSGSITLVDYIRLVGILLTFTSLSTGGSGWQDSLVTEHNETGFKLPFHAGTETQSAI